MEALLDREPAERGLGQHQHARRRSSRGRCSGAAQLAQRRSPSRRIRTETTVAAIRWLNSISDSDDAGRARRRPRTAASRGCRCPPRRSPGRIADADDAADQDQHEGGDDGDAGEPAKAAQRARPLSPRGAAASHRTQDREAPSPPVPRRTASRMSSSGSRAAHVRDRVEVVRRRRGEREPLERRAAPRVVAGAGGRWVAVGDVAEREEGADRRTRRRRSRRTG